MTVPKEPVTFQMILEACQKRPIFSIHGWEDAQAWKDAYNKLANWSEEVVRLLEAHRNNTQELHKIFLKSLEFSIANETTQEKWKREFDVVVGKQKEG